MPDGGTHHKYYNRGYIVSIPVGIITSLWEWKFGLGYVVGYSLGRYVDPDWDLMGTNAGEGRMVNEIPILGHLVFGVSSSYGSIFRKHHRSFWTHFPVVSTLIRLIFITVVPFVFLDSWGINLIGNEWYLFWLGLWAGLSHADAIHYYLDITYSGV